MVKKLLLGLALLALLALPGTAQAACVSPLAGLDATSTSRTFLTVLDGSSNCISTFVLVDGTAGANKTAVKAASTAAAAGDPALVVSLSPNSPLPAFAATPTVNAAQSGTWTVQPGNTPNTSPWLASISQGGNTAVVKAGNTAAAADVAVVVSDANVVAALNNPVAGQMFGFSAQPTATITRPANATTYTANTGWCGATAACATVFTFSNACRINGGSVLIPSIDVWSSANQTTKLQGILWLFTTTPGTIINDNATFNIAAADFANLTGNQQGFAFTMTSTQASGAANAGITLSGTTYHAQCGGGTTTLIGMVQVVNAYVPVSGEILHVTLHTVGAN